MTRGIYTPTADELDSRIGRYGDLRAMSTATDDLAEVSLDVMDIFFSRKIMPVILEKTKNPFGHDAPIYGASGTTMFISIMPSGQGACLHSHNGTFETFMVLQGSIEYRIGDPVTHHRTLNQWDTFSCPPLVYRGFRNVGDVDAVQLTVLTGPVEEHNDVSMPHSVYEQVEREHGPAAVEPFAKLFGFEPPP